MNAVVIYHYSDDYYDFSGYMGETSRLRMRTGLLLSSLQLSVKTSQLPLTSQFMRSSWLLELTSS